MRTIVGILFAVPLILTACIRLDLTGALPSGPAGHYSLDLDRMVEAWAPIIEAGIEEKVAQKPAEEREEERERLRQSSREELRKAFDRTEVSLTLEEGGTWTRSSHDEKTSEQANGTWELRGDKLLLTTSRKDGKVISNPEVEEATYKNDEITLHSQAGFLSVEFVLRRS
jgi:hypothetical protein